MLSTTRINEIIGIKESFQLPERMLQILGNPEERKRIFSEFLSYENDLSFDWFTDYFQEQHSNRENMMQDFTPKALTELLPQLNSSNYQTVADICSGTGGLAIGAWSKNPNAFFYCEELSERTIPLLLFNLAIRNMNAIVVNKNVLTSEINKIYQVEDGQVKELEAIPELPKFDFVIMNPPYSVKHDWKKVQPDGIFTEYGFPPNCYSDFAFVLHGLELMKQGGKLCAILPHGTLFRGKQEEAIRKKLCENHLFSAVIGLPDKLFHNTDIPVFVMILEQSDDTFFVDASKEFKHLAKINFLESEHIEKILCAVRLRKNIDKFAHVATFEELQKNDFNLNIPRYVDTYVPPELPDPVQAVHDIAKLNSEIHEIDMELLEMFQELTADKNNLVLHFQLEQFVEAWEEMCHGTYTQLAL